MRRIAQRISVPAGIALAFLSGCAGAHADVEGSAAGITFGSSNTVFFGGPFIVISEADAECTDFSWVDRNYETGRAPTEDDAAILQMVFAGATLEEGKTSVAVGAEAEATALSVQDGTLTFERASAGVVNIDSVEDEKTATGSFDGLAFDSGTLSGEFTAEWCRNLKD